MTLTGSENLSVISLPDEIAFDGRAPDLQQIADKVAEWSGLPVSVEDSGADRKGKLHDLLGSVSFTCAPGQRVQLSSYLPGAVRELHTEMLGDAALSGPTTVCTMGLNEPPEIQVVYVCRFGLFDPTLPLVTILALEAMGGHSRREITPEERKRYAGPIAAREVRRRHRNERIKAGLVAAAILLLLPVLIPIYVFNFSICLIHAR